MIDSERELILEEEYFIVRHSGEIPEITLHSSLYHLTENQEGPGLVLTPEEHRLLEDAAMDRYHEIVIRDLKPENRDLGLYRGVRRTIYNWHRLQDFCDRINRDCSAFRPVVRQALIDFMYHEVTEVQKGLRCSCVNCTPDQLQEFCRELDLPLNALPEQWQTLCC